ncbi:MAG: ABC transporter permease [Chloroflexi bacterium]|nr:ABC transporter permease [Chloroflexota bacterium]
MVTLKKWFSEFKQFPSAIVGAIIVLMLVLLAIFAMIKIPYSEAIRLWRGGEEVWYQNPKNVPPVWYNWFTREKLPETIAVKAGIDEEFTKLAGTNAAGNPTFDFEYSFEYAYDAFPQELFLYFNTQYETKQPFVSVKLIRPDGEELSIGDFGTPSKFTYRFSQDSNLSKRVNRIMRRQMINPIDGIFAIPESDPTEPMKGMYTLAIQGITFEKESDINVEFVMHGKVAGWFGTDHNRRDLAVAMLWGAPVALAFGLLAALFTSVLSMIIAAIGAWFGGWVDELIQRITEINLVLPFLSILIMVGTFYSRSIWVILGVTVALSIFAGTIKTDRAIFLQVKEATYIEAAKAYGANDLRIIFRYLIPRIIPLLIPALVSAVPSYVFLEASLAVLGLGDPVLPTWGKLINDAQTFGALYKGMYYWILQPAVLLMFTGLGFAMLGFALDRIFNPRLRDM